eukprot:GHVQ01030519.1.p1 GENE.GHVQ01030519.1~~GHVQ01030519.1.p1  ORF type:complete len:145 (-),score=22.08 GHVQ01030519.1:533-967(-)
MALVDESSSSSVPVSSVEASSQIVSNSSIPPPLRVTVHVANYCERQLVCQVWRFNRPLLVWIGENRRSKADMEFDDLHVAVSTVGGSFSSCLMGSSTGPGGCLAKRLCEKLGIPVQLSVNIDCSEEGMFLFVQNFLLRSVMPAS